MARVLKGRMEERLCRRPLPPHLVEALDDAEGDIRVLASAEARELINLARARVAIPNLAHAAGGADEDGRLWAAVRVEGGERIEEQLEEEFKGLIAAVVDGVAQRHQALVVAPQLGAVEDHRHAVWSLVVCENLGVPRAGVDHKGPRHRDARGELDGRDASGWLGGGGIGGAVLGEGDLPVEVWRRVRDAHACERAVAAFAIEVDRLAR
mmetsp:Transcript_17000/g.55757  ORF Transcript_17000/g.55757 Transcript_17000/m.55757 type:complete len:209 (-) Transcript_17000:99-725(-)